MDPPTYPFEETSLMDGPLCKTKTYETFKISDEN